jgi:hypothetical protein
MRTVKSVAGPFLLTLAGLFMWAPCVFGQGRNVPEEQDGLRFRFVGPSLGNRVACVAGVPGNLSTYDAGVGAVAGGAHFGPTDTDLKMLKMIEQDLTSVESEYGTVMGKDLPELNRSLVEHGIMPLMAETSAAEEAVTGERLGT